MCVYLCKKKITVSKNMQSEHFLRHITFGKGWFCWCRKFNRVQNNSLMMITNKEQPFNINEVGCLQKI